MDLIAARNFGNACQEAGVNHIVYLGGLGDPDDRLSPHLRSRQETGAALHEAGIPVTEFRSAIIIGAGSGSFEMIRYLTERIPLMTSPRWVFSRIQPIATDDVMNYLVEALKVPECMGQVVEIGGTDVMTYGETLRVYAQARKLRRWVFPLPWLTPGLSSHWVGWVTPISARIARPLIEGLRNEVVVRDDTAERLFPNIHPMSYRAAVDLALADHEPGRKDLAWLDAQASLGGSFPRMLNVDQDGMHIMRHYRIVAAPPKIVYGVVAGLGGRRGWLFADWAWRLRAFAGRLMGGGGGSRGRRHPDELVEGDAVDFLLVEALEYGRMLRLRVAARMPGRFWVQFEAHPLEDGQTRLVETVFFDPKGLLGFLYWHLFYRLHIWIFGGQTDAVAREAERRAS
jgi:uncharacterized protein YbjT (DUF2867 family)